VRRLYRALPGAAAVNGADFQQVRDLLSRYRSGLEGIKRLCLFEPGYTPDDVLHELEEAEAELGAFIEVVQTRRRMAWEDRGHKPRHAPPARWPVSPHVERFDMTGRRTSERVSAPRLSGEWTQHSPRRRHG
jgi:hypothetical protein